MLCVDQETGGRTGMAHTDTVNSLIDQIKSNQIKLYAAKQGDHQTDTNKQFVCLIM